VLLHKHDNYNFEVPVINDTNKAAEQTLETKSELVLFACRGEESSEEIASLRDEI
jgi:hypothetical protein